jgi:Holliday junction resolvase RusA-like endonuclease
MRGFEDVPVDWAPASVWIADDGTRHQTLEFIVPGQPIQQGNIISGKYGNLYDKTKGLRPWREMVTRAATVAMRGDYRHRQPLYKRDNGALQLDVFIGPVMLDVTFVRQRPKTKPKREGTAHTKFPDLDKLVRAVGDSMTGVVWNDDTQVVEIHCRKRYADVEESPGAIVLVTSNVEVK